MTRISSGIVVLAVVIAACSPAVSGPAPPRPIDRDTAVTTMPAAPTTTVATVASEALHVEPVCRAPFCLVYHLDPTASWPDGSPITGADLSHTVSVNQRSPEGHPGYSRVTGVETIDEKTALVSFDGVYGPWPELFGRVFRADEQPSDIANVSTAGAFRFSEWEEGDRLAIARTEDWWGTEDAFSGAALGDVEEITFVFIDEPQAMVDALEGGIVDVIIVSRPDAATVDRLVNLEGVELTLSPGPFWEHIDFHHEHPLMSQLWVREAISTAIDRDKVLDRTVRLIDPAAPALDNTVFMAGTVDYESHYADVFDPDRAEQIMAENGCARGDDGVQVCDGERMSFVWASTNDDPARRAILESVREDLETVGVELSTDLRSPSGFVTREFLFGGPEVWQLINFSWRARPDPIGSNSTYYCGSAGELNVNRYCSEEVESLIRGSESIADPAERASAYNEADRLYLEDLALIPLYQKPMLMAWSTGVSGPEPNFSSSGDLWNVASWSGKESIVVAMTSEPADLSPLGGSDDSADVILGALLYGAFGMSPSHERLPVLVESVDVIEGSP